MDSDCEADPLTTAGVDPSDGFDEVDFGSGSSARSLGLADGRPGRSTRLCSLAGGHLGPLGPLGPVARLDGVRCGSSAFARFGGGGAPEMKRVQSERQFRDGDGDVGGRMARHDSFAGTGSTARINLADSYASVDSVVCVSRCSSTSSTSTTTSSCGEDSIQLEPAAFSPYSGSHRRPSQGDVLTPPGLGFAMPSSSTSGRMVRRMSEAIAAVAAAGGTRKASITIAELGYRVTRRVSSTLQDVKEFATVAAAMGRRASVHVIETLELQELPGLRRLQHQSDGVVFQRFSFPGAAPTAVRRADLATGHSRNPYHAEYDSSSRSSSCSSVSDGSPHRPTRRAHWPNRMQFILACVGYCVGLGTVWRFPYLCYKSHGGVFLIPYFVTLLLLGIPMLYLEMSVGQFTRRGPIGALSMLCPLFKGAGVSSVIISFIMSTFYNVLIAYSLYYLFSAFRSELPWNSCGHRWNTVHCWPGGNKTAAEEFFDRKVLSISTGLDDPGALRWELVACLLVAWVLVYFAVWKSVRSSGRMLYLTATLPFVLVLVFLGRALTLEGADVGLRYFFKPQWEYLGDAKVWVNALAQNFNSLGVALGSVVSLSSYNRYDNPVLVDVLAVSAISVLSSMLVGLFAFATIGNIAHLLGKEVEDVLSDGPGLVFVLYPQTMAKMPAAQFWSVCFFFMMLCLGLNTQFAMVEVVATSLQDGFSTWIKRHLNSHEVLVLLICVVSFLLGLPYVTEGGIYFFQLVDHYTASISIMYLAFFEVVGVAWLYGAGRLARNVRDMTGTMPGLYMRACWWVISPATLLAVWVFFLIDYEPATYGNGHYKYPWWGEALGWGIASLSLAAIPVMAALAIAKAEGATFKEKVLMATSPRIPESKQGSPRAGSPTPLAGAKAGMGVGGGAGAGTPEAATLLPHPHPHASIPANIANTEKA